MIANAVEAARAAALPKSLLAKAASYTLSLWPRLNLFLQDPELELSNNWAETANSSTRPWAQELDPHWQRGSWPTRCGHRLDHRNLPPAQHSGSRLPGLCPSGLS